MSDFKLQQVLKTIKEHEAQGADGMILFSNYNRY
jgi:creatinase/peptidase, M24 family protein